MFIIFLEMKSLYIGIAIVSRLRQAIRLPKVWKTVGDYVAPTLPSYFSLYIKIYITFFAPHAASVSPLASSALPKYGRFLALPPHGDPPPAGYNPPECRPADD